MQIDTQDVCIKFAWVVIDKQGRLYGVYSTQEKAFTYAEELRRRNPRRHYDAQDWRINP